MKEMKQQRSKHSHSCHVRYLLFRSYSRLHFCSHNDHLEMLCEKYWTMYSARKTNTAVLFTKNVKEYHRKSTTFLLNLSRFLFRIFVLWKLFPLFSNLQGLDWIIFGYENYSSAELKYKPVKRD